MTRKERDKMVDTIGEVLGQNGIIISMLNINPLCKEVEAAINSGQDVWAAARAIAPKYHEKV